MQATARSLTSWSAKSGGNVKHKMALSRVLLLHLDKAPLSAGEDWLRKKIKVTYLGLASLERTIARQRACMPTPPSSTDSAHIAGRRTRFTSLGSTAELSLTTATWLTQLFTITMSCLARMLPASTRSTSNTLWSRRLTWRNWRPPLAWTRSGTLSRGCRHAKLRGRTASLQNFCARVGARSDRISWQSFSNRSNSAAGASTS
uniref:Uncharacterized protein n=1 Tax=Avena sativa TaxID=4498 RepID=A0ACD5TJ97_AVESA